MWATAPWVALGDGLAAQGLASPLPLRERDRERGSPPTPKAERSVLLRLDGSALFPSPARGEGGVPPLPSESPCAPHGVYASGTAMRRCTATKAKVARPENRKPTTAIAPA